MKLRFHFIGPLLLVFIARGFAAGAPEYTLTLLPEEASGISDSGVVLVGGELWQAGNLAYPPLDASASGISAAGDVAGSQGSSAAIWQNGQVTLLAPIQSSPDAYAVATAVNANAVAVGYSAGDSGIRAVQWTNGAVLDLSQAAGGAASIATGINNAGQVIVNTAPDQFLWADHTDRSFVVQNGQAANITPASAVGSYAYAINGAGAVVGTAYLSDGTSVAFRWQNGQAELAPSLDSSAGGNNVATAINDSGTAVGYFLGDDPRDATAFLWREGAAPIDLNTLISPVDGLNLYAAWGINDSGQIVGGATLDGVQEGFLLTPAASPAEVPEPASLGVLALGAFALFQRRRRAARA